VRGVRYRFPLAHTVGGWYVPRAGCSGEVRGVGRSLSILLVDADRGFADLLGFVVEQAGLSPHAACDPASALEVFEKQHPAFAIIDVDLRPWDGFELLAELRRRSAKLFILVLSAYVHEDHKVRAFELGADDYVVKPCSHRELIARLKARARRADDDSALVRGPVALEVGPLRLDPIERTLRLNGNVLRLSRVEARLLEHLMRNKDSVVPTASLARHVWGYDDAPAREVLRVTIHRIRKKLGDSGPERRFIHTIAGVGLKIGQGGRPGSAGTGHLDAADGSAP
jgi:DNA-binding response OmpR family regulator